VRAISGAASPPAKAANTRVLATSVLLLTSRMQNSRTTMMKRRLCSGSGIGIQASRPQITPVTPVTAA